MSEEEVKRLAEIKKRLEEKISELESQLKEARLMLKLVDEALGRLSFKTAAELVEEKPKAAPPKVEVVTEDIISRAGEKLGVMEIAGNTIRVIIDESIKFDERMPAFKTFLVGRVFEGFKEKDRREGKPPEYSFNYEINLSKDGTVKELILRNVDINNERLMREIRNSIRWTLERAKERSEIRG